VYENSSCSTSLQKLGAISLLNFSYLNSIYLIVILIVMKSSALWNSMDILVSPWLLSLSRIDRQEDRLSLCFLDIDIFCLLSWLVQKSVYYQVFLFMELTPLAQPNCMQMARNGELCVYFSHLRLYSKLMQFLCLQKTESLSLESVQVRLFGTQHWV